MLLTDRRFVRDGVRRWISPALDDESVRVIMYGSGDDGATGALFAPRNDHDSSDGGGGLAGVSECVASAAARVVASRNGVSARLSVTSDTLRCVNESAGGDEVDGIPSIGGLELRGERGERDRLGAVRAAMSSSDVTGVELRLAVEPTLSVPSLIAGGTAPWPSSLP